MAGEGGSLLFAVVAVTAKGFLDDGLPAPVEEGVSQRGIGTARQAEHGNARCRIRDTGRDDFQFARIEADDEVPNDHRVQGTDHQTHLIQLRREMKEAVEREDYEQASALRDEIRRIEKHPKR